MSEAVIKGALKVGQKAVLKKAGEWRDWETEKDINANLQQLHDMIDVCCEDQAKDMHDILAKWMSMVKGWRFNKRQESKLMMMRDQLDEKLILWEMASEDEDGRVVCHAGSDGSLCRKVQKQLNIADGKQKHVESYGFMGAKVNRDARIDKKGADQLALPDKGPQKQLTLQAEAVPKGFHPGVTCDKTGQFPIFGWRFNLMGEDYDLCEAEFNKLPDTEKAAYERIAPPEANGVQEVEGQAAVAALNHVGAFILVSAPSWCVHCPPAELRFEEHAKLIKGPHYVIHEEPKANKNLIRDMRIEGYPTFLKIEASGQRVQVRI